MAAEILNQRRAAGGGGKSAATGPGRSWGPLGERPTAVDVEVVPRLDTMNSRIVTISSAAHRLRPRIRFDALQGERSYSPIGAYAQSKLANLLFTYELQRRLARSSTTIAVTAHPGGSKTELARNSAAPVRMFNAVLLQAPHGCPPELRAATDAQVRGGQYFGPSGFLEARGYPKLVKSSSQSHDQAIQRRLLTISEELTNVPYPV